MGEKANAKRAKKRTQLQNRKCVIRLAGWLESAGIDHPRGMNRWTSSGGRVKSDGSNNDNSSSKGYGRKIRGRNTTLKKLGSEGATLVRLLLSITCYFVSQCLINGCMLYYFMDLHVKEQLEKTYLPKAQQGAPKSLEKVAKKKKKDKKAIDDGNDSLRQGIDSVKNDREGGYMRDLKRAGNQLWEQVEKEAFENWSVIKAQAIGAWKDATRHHIGIAVFVCLLKTALHAAKLFLDLFNVTGPQSNK